MADKPIGELPQALSVQDDSLLVLEQQGTAMKMTGKQFREFGETSVRVYVESAKDASVTATAAADRAEAARDSVIVDEQKLADAVSVAEESARAAATSETNAKGSEDAARLSEQNAKESELAAASSEANAAGSEAAAAQSEQDAAASEQAAASSEQNAAVSAQEAAKSETNAAVSEANAATSKQNAAVSEANAKASETVAVDNANLSKSWAVGGTGVRADEDNDNSKYWAGVAQAAADQATTPIQGVYNIILQDRSTGDRYALIIENARLQILGVANDMDAADLNLLDVATGIEYSVIVENGVLAIEEV